jgi:hypothetical protein
LRSNSATGGIGGILAAALNTVSAAFEYGGYLSKINNTHNGNAIKCTGICKPDWSIKNQVVISAHDRSSVRKTLKGKFSCTPRLSETNAIN